MRLFFILIFITLPLFSTDTFLEINDLNDNSPISLAKYFYALEDPDSKIKIDDLENSKLKNQFEKKQNDSDTINFGFTHSTYWLKLPLRNLNHYPIERIIEISYSRLSYVNLHKPMKGGRYETVLSGNLRPFSNRPYKNRNIVFPISIPENSEAIYYLEIQSTSPILVPAILWTREEFQTHTRNDYLGQGLYFGMVLAMVLFNLLLFIALGELIYLWYTIFIFCFAFFIFIDKGLGNEFLWQDLSSWSSFSVGVGMTLSLGTFLIFMRSMLNTKRTIPKVDKLIQLLIFVFLLLPFLFAYYYETFVFPSVLLYLFTMILILWIGIYSMWKKERSSYFFVIAFSMLLISAVMNSLTGLSILPTNILTANALQLGSAIEMILLAFALADRFNIIRKEKDKAQKEAIFAQKKLVANLRHSERILEQRVEERTQALVESNQALFNANRELEARKIELERLSVTDRLTGLYNRLMLDKVLDEVILQKLNHSTNFALILLDIDKFKSINDTYGHPLGDKILIEIAQLLTEKARKVDVVGRWGGEEFLIICRNTEIEEAYQIAEKIRKSIELFSFTSIKQGTASFGVTAVRQRDSISQMISRADQALYRAKQSGRNRVEIEN